MKTRLPVILVCCVAFAAIALAQNVRHAKQGFSMRLCFDNRGVIGRMAYPDFPNDSIGLEYPLGSACEHVFGGGLWVGGKLDTAQSGTSMPIRLVSTAYEGWSGPLFEFFPGNSVADTIWKVNGRGVPRPLSWEEYWGNSIPANSLSDNDSYTRYTDEQISPPVCGHHPLHLKVIQSGFVWNDPCAEAIQIMEYKIINGGVKQIDSVYVGYFLEGDVGPISAGNYWVRNYSGYYSRTHTAYTHNPIDVGSTPVGVSVLHASRPLDSLRFSLIRVFGTGPPAHDVVRYMALSSGYIRPDEFPQLSDTRFLISCGPFTLDPPNGIHHDALVIALAIVSGQDLSRLESHAEHARLIYLNGGRIPRDMPGNEIPGPFELSQNFPNPFNSTTTIRFTLPRAGFAKLDIYNILGEHLTTLVAGELSADTHSARWDASSFPGGVYFYRLGAGNFLTTKKMLLAR